MAIFDKLHSRAHDHRVFLYAFDLLELDGEDWRPRPLEARKAPAGIQYSGHLEGFSPDGQRSMQTVIDS